MVYLFACYKRAEKIRLSRWKGKDRNGEVKSSSYRVVSHTCHSWTSLRVSSVDPCFSTDVRGHVSGAERMGQHTWNRRSRPAPALIAVTAVPSRQSWAMQGKHTPVNSSDIQKWTAALDRACIFMDFVSGACVCADRPRPVKNSCKRNHLILVYATKAAPFSSCKLFENRASFLSLYRLCIIAYGLGFIWCIKWI